MLSASFVGMASGARVVIYVKRRTVRGLGIYFLGVFFNSILYDRTRAGRVAVSVVCLAYDSS